MRLSRKRTALAFALAAVIIALSLICLSAFPGSVNIQQQEGEAQIAFSASRRLVVSPGDCVQVEWQVDKIQAVYLNGEGVVGFGQKEVCVDRGLMPTLKVILQNGQERETTLIITILVQQPLFWLLVIGVVLCLLAAVYLSLTRAEQPDRHTRILRRVAKGFGGVLIGTGLVLLGFEIAFRAYFSAFGSEKDRLLYIYSREQIQENLLEAGTDIPLPYLNYGLNPRYEGNNSLGYRGPEITLPKPPGVFRIVAMGGSTTFGLGMDWSLAYPAQLETILRQDYGYPNIEVINAGALGYTSWDTLVNLSFRVLELQPDLIIVYDNVNDAVARTATPDCYQGMNPLRGLEPFRRVWIAYGRHPSPSTLYRYLALNFGWIPNPVVLEQAFLKDNLCQESDGLSQLDHIKANPPTYFRRNLRNIAAVARMNGVQLLLSTWAYYGGSNHEVLPDWWRLAVDEQNDVITEVARELETPYYDLMGTIQQEAGYWFDDGVHQTPTGMQEQAHLYAAYLVASGLLTPK